jgi:GDP-D-mannose dehydratase
LLDYFKASILSFQHKNNTFISYLFFINYIAKYFEFLFAKYNPEFYRPSEVDNLLGDYSKANSKLGWEPKMSFGSLVESMVQADVER